MNSLIRFDPFRDMLTMRSAMDRLFESAFSDADWPESSKALGLALDVAENENEFVVQASIPGIRPDDLEITYNNNTLTIQGETKAEDENERGRYHLRERRYGSFSRSITLPSSVKADDIQADYDAGVLTLHLPKVEEAKPRRIAISSGAGQKVIEGKVHDGNGVAGK